jgi:hypothetical protein
MLPHDQIVLLPSNRRTSSSIDYRCDGGRFWASASWLSSLNPALLPSSETRVNLRIWSRKSAYLNQLSVSKPLVTFITQKHEDLRPYIMVSKLSSPSNPGLKWVTLNACLGRTVHFLGVNIQVFWKKESRPTPRSPIIGQCPLSSTTHILLGN